MKKLFASLAIAAVVAPVWAATQTVTLSVPGMTCSACPIPALARMQRPATRGVFAWAATWLALCWHPSINGESYE